MKPVCVNCKLFYSPSKNGVYLQESKPIGTVYPLPGLKTPGNWEPYKIWMADLWKCRGCGSEIIVGFGKQPITQDFRPDFQITLEMVTHTVNDC